MPGISDLSGEAGRRGTVFASPASVLFGQTPWRAALPHSGRFSVNSNPAHDAPDTRLGQTRIDRLTKQRPA